MSFRDIFRKGFLTSYANTEITFRYAVICMAIMLILGSSLVVFRGRVLREAVEKYLHL